jgi:hypothetical protein
VTFEEMEAACDVELVATIRDGHYEVDKLVCSPGRTARR